MQPYYRVARQIGSRTILRVLINAMRFSFSFVNQHLSCLLGRLLSRKLRLASNTEINQCTALFPAAVV